MEDKEAKKAKKESAKKRLSEKKNKRHSGRTCWDENYECSCWKESNI